MEPRESRAEPRDESRAKPRRMEHGTSRIDEPRTEPRELRAEPRDATNRGQNGGWNGALHNLYTTDLYTSILHAFSSAIDVFDKPHQLGYLVVGGEG